MTESKELKYVCVQCTYRGKTSPCVIQYHGKVEGHEKPKACPFNIEGVKWEQSSL